MSSQRSNTIGWFVAYLRNDGRVSVVCVHSFLVACNLLGVNVFVVCGECSLYLRIWVNVAGCVMEVQFPLVACS